LVSIEKIDYSINDLDINIADPKAWVFWSFEFYLIICRHFTLVCY